MTTAYERDAVPGPMSKEQAERLVARIVRRAQGPLMLQVHDMAADIGSAPNFTVRYQELVRPFAFYVPDGGGPVTGEERPLRRLLDLAASRGVDVRNDYHRRTLAVQLRLPSALVDVAPELGARDMADLANRAGAYTGYRAKAEGRSRWGTVHMRPWAEYPSAQHAMHTLAHELAHAAANPLAIAMPPAFEECRAEIAGTMLHAWAAGRVRAGDDMYRRASSYLLGYMGPYDLLGHAGGLVGSLAALTLVQLFADTPEALPPGTESDDDEFPELDDAERVAA